MMKGSLITSIWKYWRANQLYWLFLLTTPILALGSSALVSIAQVSPAANINRPNLQLGSQGERVVELQAALQLLGFYTGAVDGVYQENTANAVSRFKQAAGLKPDGIVDASTWQKLFPSVGTDASTIIPALPTTTNTAGDVAVPTKPSKTTPRATTPEPKPTNPGRNTPQNQTPRTAAPSAHSLQPTPVNKRVPGIQYTNEGWPILRLGNRGTEVVRLQQQLQKLGFLKGSTNGIFGVATDIAVKSVQTYYGLEADGVAGSATWEALVKATQQPR
jgi:peptidoglycan hydrolase-like protein with peptidoglycan-binding domain